MKKIEIIIIFFLLFFTNLLTAQNFVFVTINTGADNLEPRDFMENPSIVLKIRNKPNIVVSNINDGRTWASGSSKKIKITLTEDVAVADVYEIEIHRKDKDGSLNNFEASVADNWDISSLIIEGSFKENNNIVHYKMLSLIGHATLIRFVYEGRNMKPNETYNFVKYPITGRSVIATEPNPAATNASVILTVQTGGDNLEGGNDNNFDVTIKFSNGTPNILLQNVNKGRKLDNNTEKTYTIPIPNSANIDFNAINSVEVRHTGGGGMFADNWNMDKLKVVIFRGANTRTLVELSGTPLHRFTGDTRIKRFPAR